VITDVKNSQHCLMVLYSKVNNDLIIQVVHNWIIKTEIVYFYY